MIDRSVLFEGADERIEPDTGRLARLVLRGGDAAMRCPLPDVGMVAMCPG